MKSGIYRIINTKNRGLYIGKSIDIKKRWAHHIYSSKNPNSNAYNSSISKSLREYGVETHRFEIIVEEENLTKMARLENYYYYALNPTLNNQEPLIDTGEAKAVIKVAPITYEIIAEYSSITSAANSIDHDRTSFFISRSCNNHVDSGFVFNHYWVFKKDYIQGWKPNDRYNRELQWIENLDNSGERIIRYE